MNFSAGINTGNEGLFWLSEIKKEDASIQVVLFTAYADIDLAVREIKEGAADFVVKPWDNAKLLETLKTAYNIRTANRKGISIATDKLVVSKESGMFWGESNAMQQLRSLIEKVARTDANILVTGENGTGKEMLAREIHLLSNRKNGDIGPSRYGGHHGNSFRKRIVWTCQRCIYRCSGRPSGEIRGCQQRHTVS